MNEDGADADAGEEDEVVDDAGLMVRENGGKRMEDEKNNDEVEPLSPFSTPRALSPSGWGPSWPPRHT